MEITNIRLRAPKTFHYHDITAHDVQSTLFPIGAIDQMDINFPRPKTFDELFASNLADGRRLKKYQVENLLFFRDKAEFRGICADDTGLGKTITACGIMHEFPEKVLPTVIFCKTTLKQQWWVEVFSTTDIVADVVTSGADVFDEDAQVVICSYDLLKKQLDSKEYFKPRMVVMDECQKIKNWSSARTRAMVEYCADVPYVIGLSADPISNNAMEYFPFLHICHPERFATQEEFARFVGIMGNGSGGYRLGGIADYMMDRWRKITHDIIIRHKREDVAPELPAVLRSHRFVKLEDPHALEALLEITKQFVDAMDRMEDGGSGYNQAQQDSNATMMKMRHIIGDCKVPFALDYIQEFLNEGDLTRKLTVFVHHKTVADSIIAGIAAMRAANEITCNEPFIIRGGMNEEERNNLIAACTSNQGWPTNDPFDRLMVASTLAAGEGINLQKCYDALMVERQFNPPNEEQAEGRFSRLGIDESVKNIFVTYLTLSDSLDDWFEKIVALKKKALIATHGDKESYGAQWGDENEIVQDLKIIAAAEGRKFIKRMSKIKRKRNS